LADGIAPIPLALYLYQGQLQLSAQQVWFTSCVLAHKWDAELPYPKLTEMVRETGLSIRALQYIRASLCNMGYLEIQESYSASGRRIANRYDFSPLFAQLERAIRDDPEPDNGVQEDEPPAEPPSEPDDSRSFIARYGRVIARKGIAALPRALFAHQATLGLTPQQVWFVAYILGRRWTTQLPHPSLRRMAQRTGYSERQIHNIKDELVSRGYLRLVHRQGRGGGQDTNGYDFSGLLDAMTAELAHTAVIPLAPDYSHPEPLPATPVIPAGPRRGRRASKKAVQQLSVGEVQLNSGGEVQDSSGGSWQPSRVQNSAEDTLQNNSGDQVQRNSDTQVQNATEGSVQVPSVGAAPFAGVLAIRFRGEGATQFRGEGATRFRQKESDQVEPNQEDDSNRRVTPHEQTNATDAPTYSPYIAGLVIDFSRELGDGFHGPANVTQALRLWQTSNLPEARFVDKLYEARVILREYQGKQGPGRIDNKMAYFFAVLADLVHHRSADHVVTDGNLPMGRAAPTVTVRPDAPREGRAGAKRFPLHPHDSRASGDSQTPRDE
jgi:hypothetical protein